MATSNDDRFSSARMKELLAGFWTKLKSTFYVKPSTGIPKADLESSVQTSLGYADADHALIPTAASATNQLADKAYADAIGERLEARYISADASGNPFATHAALTAATTFYYHGSTATPDTNDITTVAADEDHKNDNGVACPTRYRYNGLDSSGKVQWAFEYVINNSGLSEAQLLAVNSGVTATKVSGYDTHVADTTKHITAAERTAWNAKQGALPTSGTVSTTYAINVSGNAGTATKLATARTIALSGGATGTATSFDGSGNITIPVTSLDATKLSGTASVDTTGNAATASAAQANSTLATQIAGKAADNAVVHLANSETITGQKRFTGGIITDTDGIKVSTDPTTTTSSTGGINISSTGIFRFLVGTLSSLTTWLSAKVGTDNIEVTAYGDWTFSNTVDADISGNAATATTATKAGYVYDASYGKIFQNLINSTVSSANGILKIYIPTGTNYGSLFFITSHGDYACVFSIAFNKGDSATAWSSTPWVSILMSYQLNANKFSPIVKYDKEGCYIYVTFNQSLAYRYTCMYQGSNIDGITFNNNVNVNDSGYTAATTCGSHANITTRTVGSAVGSSSQPVYMTADGNIGTCGFKIDTSGTVGTDSSTIYFV